MAPYTNRGFDIYIYMYIYIYIYIVFVWFRCFVIHLDLVGLENKLQYETLETTQDNRTSKSWMENVSQSGKQTNLNCRCGSWISKGPYGTSAEWYIMNNYDLNMFHMIYMVVS